VTPHRLSYFFLEEAIFIFVIILRLFVMSVCTSFVALLVAAADSGRVVAPSTAATGYRVLQDTAFLRVLIGQKSCIITDYGAVGDGRHNDTAAIQAALDDCGQSGGGTVSVPRKRGQTSRYLSSALSLSHSHVQLHLEEGAVLLISNNRSIWPGSRHFISAKGVDHIAITGAGEIDGQGDVWWSHRDDFRPHVVDMSHVSMALLSNFSVRDPPNHCLELYCDHCELSGVSVLAPPSTGATRVSHNTDAVDIHGAPFYVHDCHFDTGDDNIAAHANDTLVENSFFGNGHGASIGSLCDVWLRNITFRNITFHGTTSGARIKVHDGCRGRVWNVTYEDLNMTSVGTPLDVTQFYSSHLQRRRSSSEDSGEDGFVIEDVTFRRIRSVGSHYEGSFLCSTSQPCRGLLLEEVHFDSSKWSCHGDSGCECFTHTTNSTATHVTPDVASCIGP
jgi:hypothetical protein